MIAVRDRWVTISDKRAAVAGVNRPGKRGEPPWLVGRVGRGADALAGGPSLLHFQQHGFGGVLVAGAFPLGQDDERVLDRLDPRFGVDDEGAAGFLFGDEDAVEADVEDADAVG